MCVCVVAGFYGGPDHAPIGPELCQGYIKEALNFGRKMVKLDDLLEGVLGQNLQSFKKTPAPDVSEVIGDDESDDEDEIDDDGGDGEEKSDE